MPSIFTAALLCSALLAGSAIGVFAQDSMPGVEPCLGELCPPKTRMKDVPDQSANLAKLNGTDQMPEQQSSVQPSRKQRNFNPNKHQRQRYRSAGRVSCGEGRAIVAARFNRVRAIECSGGTYTYLGRRHGDTYRILLNSGSGQIFSRLSN